MDLEKIKQRQAATKGGGGFKFQEGANNIRLFFFNHKVTDADVKAGFFQKAKLGKVEKECDRPVTIHFMGGEVNRPQLSNPKLIAKYEEVLADKGEEVARKIGPQTKFAINLVDMSEKPRKMRQVMVPKTVYNKILGKMANPDYMVDGVYGAKLVGCKGRDFVVTYAPNAKGALKYEVDLREKDLCVVLSEDLLKTVQDFYSSAGFKSLGIIDDTAAVEEEAPAEEEVAAEEEKAEEEETATEEEAAEEEVPVNKKKLVAAGKGKKKSEDTDD